MQSNGPSAYSDAISETRFTTLAEFNRPLSVVYSQPISVRHGLMGCGLNTISGNRTSAQRKGWSPRVVRRLVDFQRSYESCLENCRVTYGGSFFCDRVR